MSLCSSGLRTVALTTIKADVEIDTQLMIVVA
jgi:hypothetical protein